MDADCIPCEPKTTWDGTMTGFATNTFNSKRGTGLRRSCPFLLCALLGLATSAPPAAADPLLNDTLEKVTNTTGQAVSGTVRMPPGEDAMQADRPLSSVGGIGQDITRPVGVLTAPAPSSPASSTEPAPAPRTNPDPYRSYDAFRPYTPGILPRGTLARIYFQPGESTLDPSAQNQVAGFANSFGNRVGNVEIRGYADRASGDDARASDLAMRRALAVKEALHRQGVETGRVRASGMGNTDVADAAEDRVDILFDGY